MSSVRPERTNRERTSQPERVRPRRSVANRTVAGVLAVLAVVLIALTATTMTLATRVVETQLQDRLDEVWQRTAGFLSEGRDDRDIDRLEPPEGSPEAPDPLGAPGVPLDSVTLVIDAQGNLDAGHLTVEGETGTMSDADADALEALAAQMEPGTTERVELSTGRYLVRAATVERSDPIETLVVGVSSAEADTTVGTLLSVQVAGGAAAAPGAR